MHYKTCILTADVSPFDGLRALNCSKQQARDSTLKCLLLAAMRKKNARIAPGVSHNANLLSNRFPYKILNTYRRRRTIT
jgi:hypothetical protein